MKHVTVADLKPQHGPGPHPVLHCQKCGADYNANRGDYGDWNGFGPKDVFVCCRRPMRLAFRKVIYVEASP